MGGLKQAAKQLLWSVPVAIAFTDVVGSAIKVEGLSMRPTLNPEGSSYCDWVLVEKASIKLLREYHRGDVVVLW
jgi:inner membrane protease subunit 2